MPVPSVDHVVPFQPAMWFAVTAPAIVNSPPAYSARPVPSLWTVRELTVPFTPLPTADQVFPSHLATWLALMPPAVVNAPPTNSAGPLPSLNVAIALTA